ncbi:hypothetical protein ASG79_17365 [Arthrobacter sp. Soil761]|nr:hypothetical protein ASG79_17365 [Arthrobacter sp. Soil761]
MRTFLATRRTSVLHSQRDPSRIPDQACDGATHHVGRAVGAMRMGEGGLLGIPVHGGISYAYFTDDDENGLERYRAEQRSRFGWRGTAELVADGIPLARFHNGSPVYSYGYRNPQGLAWGNRQRNVRFRVRPEQLGRAERHPGPAELRLASVEGVAHDDRLVDDTVQQRAPSVEAGPVLTRGVPAVRPHSLHRRDTPDRTATP